MDRTAIELALITALTAATIPAQSPYATVQSPEHDLFGEAVTILGDVDGDSFDDYVISTRDEHHVLSGRTGSEITRVVGEPGYDNRSVAAAGDVNNDGIPDLLVGKEGFFSDPREGVGTVLSGADWSEIWEWTGDGTGDSYAVRVEGLGDVNNDGFDDVAVGAAWWGASGGYIDVFSGQTGQPLQRFTGAFEIAAAGDVDGDGRNDIVIREGQTRVVVYSVLSGAEIVSVPGFFRGPVAGVGDINGDGVVDIAVGDVRADRPGVGRTGVVRVFSGTDGAQLRFFLGMSQGQMYGNEIATLGDLNGDGFEELLVADSNGGPLRTVEILDLRRERRLFTATGPSADGWGSYIGTGGDVNGDGVPDAMIGAPQPGTPAPGGYVEIVSGATLSLLTDTPTVSISTGGTQTLTLDAGPSFANSIYVVLGSITGIAPGWTHNGFTIPLNIDGYLYLTLSAPNVLPLGTSLGLLDANGRGQASFTLPANVFPTAFAGITFDHAYLLLSPSGDLLFVSNPMPATLTN